MNLTAEARDLREREQSRSAKFAQWEEITDEIRNYYVSRVEMAVEVLRQHGWTVEPPDPVKTIELDDQELDVLLSLLEGSDTPVTNALSVRLYNARLLG